MRSRSSLTSAAPISSLSPDRGFSTSFVGKILTRYLFARYGRSGALRLAIAGRSEAKLAELRDGLGPRAAKLPIVIADASDEAALRRMCAGTRVLVSTVGPFTRLGRPALEAALHQGCGYVDSSGESPFIRAVFEEDGPRAANSGARLLTAFGYDFVPGNLAAALAIRDARDAGRVPVAVEVGYGDGAGQNVRREGGRGLEAAVAVAAQHAHVSEMRRRARVAGDEVGNAVTVEIRHGDAGLCKHVLDHGHEDTRVLPGLLLVTPGHCVADLQRYRTGQ